MKYAWKVAAILLFFSFVFALPVAAKTGAVLGIHILHPGELDSAKELLQTDETNLSPTYVTIPLGLSDLKRKEEWQTFLTNAEAAHVTPLIRLTTEYKDGAWQVPTKKNIVDLISFLSSLKWSNGPRYIMVFNEVNHAKEWGGQIDPTTYAETLRFTSNWAKSEGKNYQVLPAAMDLASCTCGETLEAFAYLDRMHQVDPNIFSYIDYWNSHSYPNPGFASAPQRTDQRSLRGYTFELEYLKQKTGREYQTFITETGWSVVTPSIRRSLPQYYEYAAENIWSDSRIVAVTPFVLQGDPGPFSGFSFLDRNHQPTSQYQAYQSIVKTMNLQ